MRTAVAPGRCAGPAGTLCKCGDLVANVTGVVLMKKLVLTAALPLVLGLAACGDSNIDVGGSSGSSIAVLT